MTYYQQRLGGKFLAVDRRGNKHENQIIVGFPLNFCARGFEREIWGGSRGFVFVGLKLFWFE